MKEFIHPVPRIYIYTRKRTRYEGVKSVTRKVWKHFRHVTHATRFFIPERVNAADKRRVSRGFASSDFLLRNESFGFHSHELSQFPVDSRLLIREANSGRQTRAANALSRICIFIPASWACRLKFAFERPPPIFTSARGPPRSTIISKRR